MSPIVPETSETKTEPRQDAGAFLATLDEAPDEPVDLLKSDPPLQPTPPRSPAGGPSIAEPPKTPTSMWNFIDTLDPEVSPAEQAYRETIDADPERAAKVRRFADQLDEEPSFVEKNLDHVEKVMAAPPSDYWKDLEQESPEAYAWFAAKRNMSLAKDDLNPLREIADWAKRIPHGFTLGNLQSRESELWADRGDEILNTGEFSYKHEGELKNLRRELDPLEIDDAKLNDQTQIAYQFAKQLPNITRAFVKAGAGDEPVEAGDALKRGIEGAGAGIVAGAGLGALAGGAGAVPGAVAGVSTGFGYGSTAGLAYYAYRSEYGSALKEYVTLKDQQGNTVNPRKAAETARTVGMINGALEAAGDLILLKLAAPAKSLGGMVTGPAAALVSKIPGGAKLLSTINATPKTFVGMTLGKAIREAGKRMAMAQASEISTEVTQEAVTEFGALSVGDQDFNSQNVGQALKKASGVAWPVAQSTVIFGALAGGSHVLGTHKQIQQGKADAAAYVEAVKAIDVSKLKDRSPEALGSFVEANTKGTRVENIYVAPEAMETYFQAKGSSARQAAQELGVEAQYDTAVETGRKVVIPFAKWVEVASPTPHLKGLANDITFSEDALSLNEQHHLENQTTKEVDQAVAKAEEHIKTNEARAKEKDELKGRIRSELEAAKPREMLPSDEKQYQRQLDDQAELIARISSIEALRRSQGGTHVGAGEFYDQQRIKFQNEQQAREARETKIEEPEEHVLQQAKRIEGTNVVDAFSEFRKRTEDAGVEAPQPEAKGAIKKPKRGSLGDERLEAFAAKYGTGKQGAAARKAIKGAQKIEAGPYVNADVVGSGWAPNYAAEPTGTIGPDRISEPFNVNRAEGVVGKVVVNDVETDPLKWSDNKFGATKQLIQKHAEQGIPLTINTSSDLVGHADYIAAMPADTTVRMHLLTGNENLNRVLFPGNPSRQRQDQTVEKLKQAGIKVVAIRPTPERVIEAAGGIENVMRQTATDEAGARKWVSEAVGLHSVQKLHQSTQRPGLAAHAKIPAGFSRPESVEITSVESSHLSEERHQSIKAAESFIRSNLQGPGYINSHTGWEIDIPSDGVKKFSGGSAKQPSLVAGTHLDQLIEKAIYVGKENNTNAQERNIPFFHVFYAPLQIGDRRYLARLKVAETNAGKKYYHTAVVESERPAGISEATPVSESSDSAFSGPSKVSIDDFLSELNSAGSKHVWFQDDGEQAYGQIQFAQDETIITLFREAHASTPVHEFAHAYLKDLHEFSKSNPEAAEHWKPVADWLGVTDEQAALTDEQQEKFAHGFDDYLQKGEAPTEALKRVFARFRRWLTAIYRKVKGENIEIDPRAKAIFDRMVATEDEIAAAEAQAGRTPIQASIDGLSDADAKRLARLQEQAREEAEGVLLRRQMDELKADRGEFLATKRKELTEEIRARLSNEQIYAIQEKVRAALKSSKSGKTLANEYLEGTLHGERVAMFDMQAELAGYTSGDQLAKAIKESTSLSAEVGKQVAQEMAVYADLKDTSLMKEEAMKAIHSEHSYELMALENEILQALHQGAEISDEAKRRKAEEARFEAQAIKARAKDLLWRLNLRGATAYGPIFTAERRAAVSAAKAMMAKDYERAAVLKRQQMLNHALAQESLKLKKKSDGWIAYLNDLRTKKQEAFKKEEHFYQVAEILERLGFGRRDYDPQKRTLNLAQWAQQVSETTNILNIPDWVKDEKRILPYQELTVTELQDAVNTLKNIMKVANFENRAFTIDKGASFDEIKAKLRMDQELNRKGRKRKTPPFDPTTLDQTKSSILKYGLSLKKIRTMLVEIQGFKDFGEWTEMFEKPVHLAADVESEIMQADTKALDEAFAVYTKEEKAELINKQVYYPELGTSTAKMRLLMMAMNLGNEDNRTKLTQNKLVGVDESVAWDDHTVMDLLQKNLTAKDWNFVQNIWDLLEAKWVDISNLHKDMTGFSPAKVAATPLNVQTKDGQTIALRGGYFPLREDPRASVRAATLAELDSPLYTEQNPGWVAATKTGHTKARTGAQYSVSLDHNIIFKHLRDVNHDLAFRKVVTDLRRLVADKEVQQMIASSLGVEGYQEIREWVSAVAADQTQVSDPLSRFSAAIRRNTVVAALGFRVGVITQNLANVFLYAGSVDGFGKKEAFSGFMTYGLPYWMGSITDRVRYNDMRSFVFSQSAFMRDKNQSPDFSLHEAKAKGLGLKTKSQEILEFSGGLMAGTDELTSIPMWTAAYKVGIAKGLENEEAVYYADTMIKNTLGSGRRYDTARVQRSTELTKLLSMFYTFLNTEHNRWVTEYGRASIDQKDLPRFLGFVGSRLILFNSFSMLFSGKLPGEDDDPFKWWIKQTLTFPLAFFPGVRDVANVALDEMLGIKSFGYQASPAITPIVKGLGAAKTTADFFTGDADGQQTLESLSRAASYAIPYPDQFNAWFFNAYDTMFGKMKPQGMDLMRRRPQRER